ncbi:MAG TPA: L-lactate permease [Bryobacteraceae bacterium]|jgi:lactate permease|nr:L-lactate permease [Bryobacteraceae bacterium]
MNQPWLQNFNPLGNPFLSTAAAAIPVCTLFYFLAVRRTAAWLSAVLGFAAAVAVALVVFHMPLHMVAGAVADGLVFGWFRIAWIVVAAVFVYELSVASGYFEIVKLSVADISPDRRLQVLLIAFAFGALLEGAGGGGAPVAITGAMMIGLGFPPFQTAIMCLIANSAPVAYGGLGNPVRTLVAVTGLPEADFSAMLGRILPLTTLVLPFWLVRVLCKTRETIAVWPGLLACGLIFGSIQFFWSNFIGASLVDIVAGIGTLLLLAVFFKIWRPASIWRYEGEAAAKKHELSPGRVLVAWMPFLLLAGFVVIWGLPSVTRVLDRVSWKQPVPGLHLQVVRMPPVTAKPYAEPALFDVSWLSTPGTGIFFAGLIAGPLMGLSLRRTLQVFFQSLWRLRLSLLAILAMLGLGYVTRYCGMDATMGMAMAHTGVLFPFFGTTIGWLGVALSGTDAGSNALFGSLQVIAANKLGLSPILMGAANSAGGVMGKMIAAQSLVIGCAVTGQEGKEGELFRAVLKHSLGLLALVGLIVLMYAYVFPGAVPSGHKYW